ncbi:hypothetical protein B0T14DRAFT_603733 [Immersiella caudata]|uniref:Uncharacterized protein n=1 Tax=Immersiella caudata TaxID=314043 RepID=A0AA39WR44_9PEZI|nr:hypothetical protein B0T14DRAFT_603733 [Immersiella caudata]
MRITALPVPTAAPELLRRQDAAVCGRDYDGNSPISCAPSSTCALAVNSIDGKDHAGCHSAGDVIPTSCSDASTVCDSCSEAGVVLCMGNMYCATRFWYPAITAEFQKPIATSYFCHKGSFLQVSATYLPNEFGAWNSAPATDPLLRQTRPGGQSPSNPTSSPATTRGGSSSGSDSSSEGNADSSTASPGASSPLSTGAIAGIAVGGGLLLVVAIAIFIFLRRRKRAASQPATTRPNPSRDETLLNRGATPLEHYPYPVEKEGGVGLRYQTAPPQEQLHHLSQTSSGHSIAGENSDTLGGLPQIDDTRTVRTRGAPSVMTDMSETLTLGGDGDIDDIHAIGHGR